MILKGDIEEAVGVALDGGVVRGPVIRINDMVIKYMIGGTRGVVKDMIVKMIGVMIRIKDIMGRIKDTGEVRGKMIGIKDRMVKIEDPAEIKDITVEVRGEVVTTGRTGNNNALMLVILALGTTSQIVVNNRLFKIKDPAKIKDTTGIKDTAEIKDITVGVRGEAVITSRTGNNNALMLVILALGTTSQIIVNNREGLVMRNTALWLQPQDRNTITNKMANHHTAEEVLSKAGAFTVVALPLDPLEVKGAMVMTS